MFRPLKTTRRPRRTVRRGRRSVRAVRAIALAIPVVIAIIAATSRTGISNIRAAVSGLLPASSAPQIETLYGGEFMSPTSDWGYNVTHEYAPEANTQTPLYGRYPVVRVIDGDTIIVSRNGTDERVRLIGIDAPESVHSNAALNTQAGLHVSEFLGDLLTGSEVYLQFDVSSRDRFDRLLAYVFAPTEDGGMAMINALLLERGYATASTHPPNVMHSGSFYLIQEQARLADIGFWTEGEFVEN